jgi:hypothetical protein
MIALDKLFVSKVTKKRTLVNMQKEEVVLEKGQRVSMIAGHIGSMLFFGIQSQLHGLILLDSTTFFNNFNKFKAEI